ncbi:MAG: BACON domain-containing protein, partial [Limisphaerales bacterium]
LMLLLPDGTVMAQNSGTSVAWYRLTPDIHGNYANGTWTTLKSMHDNRLYVSSDVLKDGRVFIAGGEYGRGTKTAEVYDPLCNAWTMAPPSGQSFSDSVSKVIANGNVMVCPVGPSPSGHVIFFDITANNWIAGPKLFRGSYQDEATWVKLPDNSILTIDPFGTHSERYIPSSNTWVDDGVLPVSLYDSFGSELGAGFLLPDGRVFYLGATGHTAYYTPTGTTSPGTWVAGPDIPNAQGTPDAAAAMMVNGKILCAVSPVPTSANHFPSPTSFYEFDYVTDSFTSINAPTGATESNPSYYTTMLDLPDGTVLHAHFASQLYTYTPDGPPLAAGKPTISAITQNTNSTFHLTGTGLNGICEGACYGDDLQMDSNYPLVRLTNSAGNVYYARTFNWSSTGLMTGSAVVSTDFVLPAGLAAGTYSLVVVANGNASDPVSFNFQPIIVSVPASATEGSAPLTGTVTLPIAPASDLTVNLSSSLPARAGVPATVTIAAGQTSTNFAISIIDDALLNHSQAAMISASADSYQGGVAFLLVNDNESAVLGITAGNYNPSGYVGGPFSPSNIVYTLTNSGTFGLNWTAAKTASWLTLSPTSGTLAAGASANFTVSVNSGANSFPETNLTDTIIFNNTTSGDGNASRSVALTVTGAPALAVSSSAFSSSGPVGGPFSPVAGSLSVSNTGLSTMGWTVTPNASWITASPTGGTLAAGTSTSVNVSINSTANTLTPGAYTNTLSFANTNNGAGNTTRAVMLSVQPPVPVMTALPAFSIGTSNTVSWNTVAGATSYESQFAATASFAVPLATHASTSNSSTFNSLANGVTYYYRARSLASSVTSAWSTVVFSTQDAGAPLLNVASLPINPYTTHPGILLQGTASDTVSGLASVTVNGSTATTSDGFAHWSFNFPLAVGTNQATIVATDRAVPGGNQKTILQTVIRQPDQFGTGLPDDWKAANGLDPNSIGGDNAPLADPNHNGLPNLLDYAFNTDPVGNVAQPFQFSIQTNSDDGLLYLTCSYPRRTGALDLTYSVDWTDDFSAWTNSPAQIEQIGAVPNDNVTETVTLRLKPAISPGTQKFIRPRVTFQ